MTNSGPITQSLVFRLRAPPASSFADTVPLSWLNYAAAFRSLISNHVTLSQSAAGPEQHLTSQRWTAEIFHSTREVRTFLLFQCICTTI